MDKKLETKDVGFASPCEWLRVSRGEVTMLDFALGYEAEVNFYNFGFVTL